MAAPDLFRRHGIVSGAIGFVDWYHTDVMGATPSECFPDLSMCSSSCDRADLW
jgi:hypothetical protein